jgi:HAD superfamily hydrolase (TIGR01509 family)
VSILLLDLTGVLFDYDARARTAALCAATGIPTETVRDLIFRSGFFASCVRGEVSEADERAFFRAALEWDAADDEVDRVWATGWTSRPDTLAVLEQVPRTVERALLTNNDPVMRHALGTLYPELTAHVTTMLSSEQLGAAKPAPAAFTRALELLGASAHEAHFIDDTLENVEAAQGVGIRSAKFRDPAQMHADLRRWGLIDPNAVRTEVVGPRR